MSNIGNVSVPSTGAVDAPSGDAAVDAYRRAVAARPTSFAQNPIGAMAQAMDRIGRAAGDFLGGGAAATSTVTHSMQTAEQTLIAADKAASANPSSIPAKQNRLNAALGLLQQMSSLSPSDPRRVRVAALAVQLANELGPNNLPSTGPGGTDLMALLRLAATTVSRYGTSADMQSAFKLEQMLKQMIGSTDPAAAALLDKLMAQLGLSGTASALIARTWQVRIGAPNELASADVATHTLVLNENQLSGSLSALARAWWSESSLANPANSNAFVKAFMRLAGQGSLAPLKRKYKEASKMAKLEVSGAKLSAIGAVTGAPVTAVTGGASGDSGADGGTSSGDGDDAGQASAADSANMFAALAVFHASEPDQALPDALAAPLAAFLQR